MDYSKLVHIYEQLESTSKRLEKTFILSEFLKTLDENEIEKIMLLVQSRVFPQWDQRELGVAAKLVVKAITRATGCSQDELEKVWKETGDLGLTAEKLVSKKTQATLFSEKITVSKIFENLQKIAELEGTGTVDAKLRFIAELLTSASPKEAKYIVRTVLEDLRVGLGEGTIRDAIVWAFFSDKAKISYDREKNDLITEYRTVYQKYVDVVQGAIDVTNDFARVAVVAKGGEEGLNKIPLTVGKPVKVMLFQKAKDMEDAFSTVGKPAAIEFKYDGFRLQIHKNKDKVSLFTRRLEDVTRQFPDVVSAVKNNVQATECILDAEVIGIDRSTKKVLPFQNISQRIRRKYDIEQMADKFPVQTCVFDILSLEGDNLLKVPFAERRKKLESIITSDEVLTAAKQLLTDDVKAADELYKKALASGNEGVMVKNLEGVYKPGSRVGFGVKVKPIMDTLEVVIVGAEWGEGKRGQWLASFVIAVRHPDTDEFLEIGKVGTGIKEKAEEGVSFDQMTQLLQPLIVDEGGRSVRVKPEIVIEVDYEEIQASPTYDSKYALRFPRFVCLRDDRSPKDINTVVDVKRLYESQRGRG